jgi:hypothetical protein
MDRGCQVLSGGRGVKKPHKVDRDGLWSTFRRRRTWTCATASPAFWVGLAASLRSMPTALCEVFEAPSAGADKRETSGNRRKWQENTSDFLRTVPIKELDGGVPDAFYGGFWLTSEAPELHPRGILRHVQATRTPSARHFAPCARPPGSIREASCAMREAPVLHPRGILRHARGTRLPSVRHFAPCARRPCPIREASCAMRAASEHHPRGILRHLRGVLHPSREWTGTNRARIGLAMPRVLEFAAVVRRVSLLVAQASGKSAAIRVPVLPEAQRIHDSGPAPSRSAR